MQVRVLKEFLDSLTEQDLEKELSFYDAKTGKAYFFNGKETVEVVDLSDETYLDIVFNN